LFIKQLISACRHSSRPPAMMANICWISCLGQRTGGGPATSGWCRGVRPLVLKHLYPVSHLLGLCDVTYNGMTHTI
jgi:hypothetical protein